MGRHLVVYPAHWGGGICTDWFTGLNATRKINGYKWGECIPLKHSPPHWEREGCQGWVGQQKVRSRVSIPALCRCTGGGPSYSIVKVKVRRSVSWALSRLHSTANVFHTTTDAPEKALLEGCVDDIVDH